jgi:hypothetical protein
MTTAHRPQADGETERTNRRIIEYLQMVKEGATDQWDGVVELAQLEFSLNSHISSATGTSAFHLTLNRPPLPPAALDNTDTAASIPLVARWRAAHDKLREARARMVADKAPPAGSTTWKIGDWAFLHTKDYPQLRHTKLDKRFAGPFRVLRVLSQYTLVLELPPELNIHNTINTDRLKRATITIADNTGENDNNSPEEKCSARGRASPDCGVCCGGPALAVQTIFLWRPGCAPRQGGRPGEANSRRRFFGQDRWQSAASRPSS